MVSKTTDISVRLVGVAILVCFTLLLFSSRTPPTHLKKLLPHERSNFAWVVGNLRILWPEPDSLRVPRWVTWLMENSNQPNETDLTQIGAFKESLAVSQEVMGLRLKELVYLSPMWVSFILLGIAEGSIVRLAKLEMNRKFGLETSFTIALSTFLSLLFFLPFYLTLAVSIDIRIFAFAYGIAQGFLVYWATAIKPAY